MPLKISNYFLYWIRGDFDSIKKLTWLPYLGKIVNRRLYKLFRSRDMGRAVAVRRWTPAALECYKRGCNCEGCFYKDFFNGSSHRCQMKASVLELVRVIGTPNVELQQFIIED